MAKEEFDIKTEYNKLTKKYELPNFDDLNNEFEISSIDKQDFLSRRIRRRLSDKVVFYCKILENIIYPTGQNPLSLYELNFLSGEEKQELASLHKKLMIFERQSLLLDVNAASESEDIEYIKSLIKDWPELKKVLVQLVTKMRDSWSKELKDDGEKYFG